MKAAIYARVSSLNERQSTDRQVIDLRNYADRNNIEVIKVYEEHISGAKRMRNALYCANVWTTVLAMKWTSFL